MPQMVVLGCLVEAALILVTCLLLTQPDFLFRNRAERARRVLKWVGIISLCLTFCWSVVVGVFLSMNEMTIRL